MKYFAQVGERTVEVDIGSGAQVRVDGKACQVDLRNIDGGPLFSVLVDGASYEVFVERSGGEYRILLGGGLHIVLVEDERARLLGKTDQSKTVRRGEVMVKAPMPGLVVAVKVVVGERVSAGQGLVILEAMKMENEIRSPQEGEVKAVSVSRGQAVEQNQTLVILG